LPANKQRKGALLEEGSFHSSIHFSSFSSVRRKNLETSAVKEIGTHVFPGALPAKSISLNRKKRLSHAVFHLAASLPQAYSLLYETYNAPAST